MGAAVLQGVSFGSGVRFKRRLWLTAFCLALSDLVANAMASAASFLALGLWHSGFYGIAEYAFLSLFVVVAFAAFGLYPLVAMSPAQELRRILVGSTVVYGVVAGMRILQGGDGRYLLARLAVTWGMTVAFVVFSRALVRHACAQYSWWGIPTILFGSGTSARSTFRFLKRNARIGLKVVAVFDEEPLNWPEFEAQRLPYGSIQEGLAFAETSGVDHAIIAISGAKGRTLQDILRYEMHGFKNLLVVPDLSNISSLWVEPRDIGGALALHVSQALRHPASIFIKRLIDMGVALTGGLLLLPLFVALCLAVRLSSPGPIFYGHSRIGRNNSAFKVWKFRSMYPNGDEILRKCLEDPALKEEWTLTQKFKKDPRVTPLGRLMRKTSLDELPQLWNVLTGDMSLVGPRPIITSEIARYGADFQAYAAVRPGITGLWQISGRNNTSYEERVQFDEYYVRNWSVFLDLYITLRTVKTVLAAEGAY